MRSVTAALVTFLGIVGPGVAVSQESPDGWTLQFQVGDSEDRPEYMFGRVADMTFGPDGNAYILDVSDASVKVYDGSGRHLRSFGSRGDGPGEAQWPTRIVASGERVRVYDPSRDRVAMFSLEGEHIETQRLREVEERFDVLEPLRHGFWLGSTTSIHTPAAMVQLAFENPRVIRRDGPAFRDDQASVVALIQESSGAADTIFTYDHGFVVRFTANRRAGLINRYWGPGGGWTVGGDSIVAVVDGFHGTATTYRIDEDGWDILWENALPLVPKPLGESEWAAIVEASGVDRSPSAVLVGPRFEAQVGEPLFTDDGALWIRKLDFDPITGASASGTYFVLDAESEEPRELQLPDGFVAKAIRDDLVLGHRRTEWDVDVVELWRVDR